MQRGIIGLGMWCVDTTYKIDNLPERGKLEPISNTFQCVGGGPSNVLTDLNSLGFKHPMYAMGSIGLDTDASIIKKHCRENKIETKYLIVSKQISTSHTVCMFEKQKERTFLYYPGANSLLDKKHFKINQLKIAPKVLYVGYITLLGKLDKFDVDKKTRLSKVLKKAKSKNVITVLDLVSNKHPKYKNIIESSLPFTDYLLLNEIESEILFNRKIYDFNKKLNQKTLTKLISKVFKKGIIKGVVIHSPTESLYFDRSKKIYTRSKVLPKSRVINSVGAGDAFCAAFIFGIHENWDIKKTLKKAHAAGTSMIKVNASSGNLPNISKL